MKLVGLISAAICCIAVAGCAHHHHGHHPSPRAAKIVVPAPKVVVEKAPGKHCPPGQAKKGNC
jgi:hypothetical protein